MDADGNAADRVTGEHVLGRPLLDVWPVGALYLPSPAGSGHGYSKKALTPTVCLLANHRDGTRCARRS